MIAGRRLAQGVAPFLYVAPALLFLLAFILVPLFKTAQISFFDWNLVSEQRTFVGWGNYLRAIADPQFHSVLAQSALYVVFAMLGNVALPLGLALLTLRLSDREADWYQSIIFLPTVVPVSIGALIFLWIYLPTGGLLSALVAPFGLHGVPWLNDPKTALVCVAVVATWKFFGFNYLIVLAGLRAIPASLLEAAHIDGATGGRLLLRIILPLLAPTLLFASVTAILQALDHSFVPIQILTVGGPSNSSNQLIYSIFQDGFQFFQAGKASALSCIYLALFAGFAVWQFRMLDRYVHYEG